LVLAHARFVVQTWYRLTGDVVTQSVHQNAGSIGQTLTTSMISRLNVNAGFDSDEICDRFRLDVLVNPPTTIYEFRQTSAVCISVSLSGLGAWVITSE
jgi:hypothetical protein